MPQAVYLSDELARQLTDAAKRVGKPPEALVEEALRRYLSPGHRQFVSVGAGEDVSLDARQTRELLKELWGKR
jgi:predicted transcriptional regulator